MRQADFAGSIALSMAPLFRSLFVAGSLVFATSASAQLNGTYTIGTAGNYATFTAAVSALTTNGVNGPVVFNVFSGTYAEQLSIGAVAGTSAANTITFQSQVLDSTAVILQFPSQASAANDWTVRLNGGDFITFRKMTIRRSGSADYGCVVDVATGSTDLSFLNCRLLPSTATTGGQYREAIRINNSAIGTCTVDRCAINYGSGSLLQFCTSGSFTFTNNTVTNALVGARLYSTSCAVQFSGNTINCRNSGGTRGVMLDFVSGTVQFSRNRLQGANNTYYGILLNAVSGTAVNPIRFENNSILATNSNLAGISILGGTCNYLDFFHNSVSMTGGTAPDAFAALGGSGVGNRISNNIFSSANGSGMRVSPASRVSASDHNVIRSGGIFGVYWGTTWYYTQATLAAGSGMNLNAMFTDPLFVNNASDLHLQATSPCLGAGQVIATVTDDIDGEARPQPVATNPEIGADERPEQCTGLNGTYVIGPSGAADYPTFNAAVTAMVTCGISAPVVFEVENGTYTEQVVLPAITGNSNVNTITFRGQSLDSSLVILSWPTGSAAPTLRFSGADRVTIEHITIQRTGNATLQGAVVDWEYTTVTPATRSEYITIRNCRLISSATGNSLSALVLGLAQNDERQVDVIDCNLQGGWMGVLWYMDSEVSLNVQGCVFSGQYNRSIACTNAGTGDPELYIENNIIQGPTAVLSIAVQIQHNSNLLRVNNNRIAVTAPSSVGLDLTCAGADPYWTHAANNMVLCTGTAHGIRLQGACTGLGLFHNSVSAVSGTALLLWGPGSGDHLVGNALRSNTGYAIWRTGTITFDQADHNALFSASGAIAEWGGPVFDIATLRCLTGQQLNSIQADPLFVNNTSDLHLQAGSPCAGQSINLTSVAIDHDGQARALPVGTGPDIGADEINADCTLIAGTYIIGASGAAHFPTFTAAVSRLLGCGIAGPVVFEVENGTYNEQVVLSAIKGSSSLNTVTFRGQALDSTTVVLQWPSAVAAGNNHVLMNAGADHVRFEHMTLRRTGAFTNARVVHVSPVCDAVADMRFSHCVIESGGTTMLSADLVYRVLDPLPARITLDACALLGGAYAVDWQPPLVADTVNITRCRRTGGTYGMGISSVTGPVTITGNELTGTANDAVLVSQCTGAIEISRNRITGGSGAVSSGIYVAACQPVAPARAVVANNEIIFSGGNGIRINGPSARVDVVFNSARMLSATGVAMAAANGGTATDTRIRNNIFSSNNWHAAWVSLTGITAERNMFWRSGTAGPAVYWNGAPYTTAAALMAGSGTNANSWYQNPLFFDPATDLRCYAMEVDQAAAPFAGIATDKDNAVRDAANPDLGAFEFQPQLWNEAFNTCGAADPITSTGTGTDQWIYKDRKVVARFNDNGQNLGTVSMNVFVNNAAVRQSLMGQYYLDRNWHLATQNAITTSAIVRLFHSGDEFATYAAADPVVNVYADAGVAHYAGSAEDCELLNNGGSNIWTTYFAAAPALESRIQATGGTHGYTAVVNNDGELYITTMGAPLPVELLSFTATRINDHEVRLDWTTATEHNNAGFEVWRMIEGEDDFTEVAWVDGAGNSQQLIGYTHPDDNAATKTSYYKLRQVDHDGQSEWSPVVAVEGAGVSSQLVAYPNPARDVIMLSGPPERTASITLHDASGRVVEQWINTTMLDGLGALERGVYLLRAADMEGHSMSTRVVLE